MLSLSIPQLPFGPRIMAALRNLVVTILRLARAFHRHPGRRPPVPSHPRPEDLSIGPPNIINGNVLAAESPAQ